jgi:hypothetical protein
LPDIANMEYFALDETVAASRSDRFVIGLSLDACWATGMKTIDAFLPPASSTKRAANSGGVSPPPRIYSERRTTVIGR